MPNPNTLYANSFIDALVAAGLRRVCIAPGSRHSSLVLALARHEGAVELYSHLDERSAAFFALGCALASGEPAAVLCTSGTAAANCLPAVIEAHQARLPLLMLTADRPPELRGSGANQTIDQLKLFGDYAALFVDAPLPTAVPPPLALRHLRTLAARAFATARDTGAVVHINFPFRKPFEPTAEDAALMPIDRRPPTRFPPPPALTSNASSGLPALLTADMRRRRGLIFFGHGSCRSEAERQRLLPWARGLARVSGFPILAETTSNMRLTGAPDYAPIGAYETFLSADAADFAQVEVLIRFGAPPISRALADALQTSPPRYHIFCSRAGEWADDSHRVTHLLRAHPAGLSPAEWEGMSSAESSAWRQRLTRLNAETGAGIKAALEHGAYFDGGVLYDVVALLPAGAALFAGNSLPARHLDQFGLAGAGGIFAYANRGASGIDGNVSTALGIGAARRGKPLVAVLGDITFYHDMNGLLALRRCDVPAIFVLLNNGGGGIFHRLPIRDHEPAFSRYFLTPPRLDFAQAAQLYGMRYTRADDRETFRQAFRAALSRRDATLIEVRTDARADLKRRAEIVAQLRDRLAEFTF